ncbi:MAG TPA: SMP-30/gluconolactonase/LRE family protein [Fibrobacteria bacterium]|nr:SMP-30/gluconolactonase/LRE family protein [Fibrobacteria bacterium]
MLHHRAILVSAAAFMLVTAGWGQNFGTVELPTSIADAGTQVVAVFNKNPSNNAYLGYGEGPAVDAQGNLFFSEHVSSHRIWKVTPQGTGTIFATDNKSNGIEFDPQGRMIVAQNGALGAFDKDGKRTTLPMTGSPASGEFNDLSIGSNGGIFFTNYSGNTFFYRNPSGAVTSYVSSGNPLGVNVPNGIEWVEEKNLLLVCSSTDHKVYRFDVTSAGVVSNKREFSSITVRNADGLTVDEKGNVYVASWELGSVQVFDSTGKFMGKVTVKNANPADNNQNANVSNCVLGDDKNLYITGDGGAYKVQLKVGPRKRPGTVAVRGSSQWRRANEMRLSNSVFHPSRQALGISLPLIGGLYTVSIYDARMRQVWSTSSSSAGVEWRGENHQGAPLPAGNYLIMATSAGQRAATAPVVLLSR